MSIQEDIVSVLQGSVSARVFPQSAEHNEQPPFVVYRRISKQRENTFCGASGPIRSSFVFECYGVPFEAAQSLAEEVELAIQGSSLLYFDTGDPGEDYDPESLRFMEPVYFDFWEP